jgi:hypothetical protein
MTFYRVNFSIGKNNEYAYPKSVADVVWKSTIYHFKNRVMIGETDVKVKADGKRVIALKSNEAKKLKKQFESSFPKLKEYID